MDGFDVAGVFKSVQAEAANHTVCEGAAVDFCMKRARNDCNDWYQKEAAHDDVEHKISELQFHRAVGW